MQHTRCRPAAWAATVFMLLLYAGSCGAEEYAEEVLLHELADGATLAHFELSGSTGPSPAQHAGVLPPPLLDLVDGNGVLQLELSLTQGRWSWEQEQLTRGTVAATAAIIKPPGLELRVAFNSSAAAAAAGGTQAAYAALTRALGGLLCAGVASVPQLAVIAAPAVGWFPRQQPAAVTGRQQAYAWLPQEALCAENLAAWRRLLPCRQHAGVAALLQPLRLAAAPYVTLGLQLWQAPLAAGRAEGGSITTSTDRSSKGSIVGSQSPQLHVRWVLSAVLPAVQRPPQTPSPAPLQLHQPHDCLLEAVFGSSMPAACPAASNTVVYIMPRTPPLAAGPLAAPSSASGCSWQRVPAGALLVCNAAPGACLASSVLQPGSVSSGSGTAAAAAQDPEQQQRQRQGQKEEQQLLLEAQDPPALIRVVQHVVQRGSRAGTLVVGVRVARSHVAAVAAAGPAPALEEQLQGHREHQQGSSRDGGVGGSSGAALLHVMQLLPWQLPVEASSLQLSLDGQALLASSPEVVWMELDARPDRTAVIELLLQLPLVGAAAEAPATAGGGALLDSSSVNRGSGGSSSGGGRQQWHDLVVSIGYQAAFISVFDHAPDASRGVDIPPALVTLVPHACTNTSTDARMHSSGSDADNSSSGTRAGAGTDAAGGCSPSSTNVCGQVRLPCRPAAAAEAATAAAATARPAAAPLLQWLVTDCGIVQWYSGGGAVIPLPLPDFSMPFNVICFTSTLLAILFGGVTNVVFRSPEDLAGRGAAAGSSGTPVWKRKLQRVLALLVLMGVLAVYLDRDLQRQADTLLHHLLLGRTQAPEQHGEL